MPLELRARGRLFGGLVKLLWLGAIFVAGLGVAAKAEQPLPNPMPEAWQDPLFTEAFIDIDEWREKPVRHR